MDKQQLAEEYARYRGYSEMDANKPQIKADFLAGYEAANIEQEKIKAKIAVVEEMIKENDIQIECMPSHRYNNSDKDYNRYVGLGIVLEDKLIELKNSLQND